MDATVTALRATTTELMGPRLQRLQRNAVVIGVVGLALTAIGAVVDPTLFPRDPSGVFHSYLYAYLFWLGATVGSMGLLMIHHVVGGGWGYLIRRQLEAASRLLPLMMLLFVPLLFGLAALFPWARPEAAADPVLRVKSGYLNLPFFIGRWVLYFLIWMGQAYLLNKWGNTQNERDDPEVARRLNVFSAFSLVVIVLTVTFAAVDWVMSLTPEWFSSIFGLLAVVSQGLTAMALALVLFSYLMGEQPLLRQIPSGYYRDLGNLLLMMIMLWAYMSFSQYLLQYSGNLVVEGTWYVQRRGGGWGLVSLFLIPAHFFLPFLVLLVGSGIKRDPKKLARVAGYVLVMRFVDLFWWVTPTFRPHLSLGLADVGTPLLIGGIWLWVWAGQMKGKPMLPQHDARLEGALQGVAEHG